MSGNASRRSAASRACRCTAGRGTRRLRLRRQC
jgi:hypothetical protein